MATVDDRALVIVARKLEAKNTALEAQLAAMAVAAKEYIDCATFKTAVPLIEKEGRLYAVLADLPEAALAMLAWLGAGDAQDRAVANVLVYGLQGELGAPCREALADAHETYRKAKEATDG